MRPMTLSSATSGMQNSLSNPYSAMLVADESVIGLIDVFDTRPRDYAEYVDFLSCVGQMAAAAVQNALLVDKFERVLGG